MRPSPRPIILALAVVCFASAARAQTPRAATATDGFVPVLPNPLVARSTDSSWTPPRVVRVTLSGPRDPALTALAPFAVSIAQEGLGGEARADLAPRAAGGAIRLRVERVLASLPVGGHRLDIGPSGVEIVAASPEGIFHGLQSLRQLFLASERGPQGRVLQVRGVRIEDAPRFSYRGLHLDVGRHFQPVAFIKRYIDLMSRFKLNTFHWHLTEDQGWRIEIKKYPKLTTVGACRAETMIGNTFDPVRGDGTPHCGFYTQEEVREVVAYAKTRFITVVPEIEMPGHTVAALAAYPELACTAGPFAVRTTWGVDENIFCPSEATFGFLEDVLTEVLALFPSTLIHIGGDEAPKTAWKASALAQEVIKREGLKDEHELQSWFIRRIERFLSARGRRLVGWDEILEGGLAPGATVMSWRGVSGGIEAAKAGHDVIMTPTSNLYFDYYQGAPAFEPLAIGGRLPLETVYAYEPVPTELTPDAAKHILGAQGNVWTEYLKTPAAIEYMAWPRALALAEVTWSAKERRDWEGFVDRLPAALRVLDLEKVNYRLPSVVGIEEDRLTLDDRVRVTLRAPIAGGEIHYTLDGTDPTATSPRYSSPLELATSAEGVTLTARVFTRDGKGSPPRAATYRRATLREAEAVDLTTLAHGLRMEYYEASLRRTTAMDTLVPLRQAIVDEVARPADARPEHYALKFTGFLRAERDGLYEFVLESDDGSTLTIGDRVVIDHDGPHGSEERAGAIALRAGLHSFTVRYFQAGGGASLRLTERRADGSRALPDGLNFLHRR